MYFFITIIKLCDNKINFYNGFVIISKFPTFFLLVPNDGSTAISTAGTHLIGVRILGGHYFDSGGAERNRPRFEDTVHRSDTREDKSRKRNHLFLVPHQRYYAL